MACRSLKTPFQLFKSLRAHSEHENSLTLVGVKIGFTPTLIVLCSRWFKRFGQNFTLSFKQKCFPQTTNLCRGCQASPETISHIILECPVAARQREKLQKEIGDLTLRSVLGTAKSMRATESFISSSKLHEIFFNCI